MPNLVVNGAMLKCSMGMAPGSLTVLPACMIEGSTQPVATVMGVLVSRPCASGTIDAARSGVTGLTAE